MECRLQSGSRWSCDISLRFTVDSQGRTLPQMRTVAFSETLYDKSQVQDRLRQAQRAILRPTILDHKLFLNNTDLQIQDPPALSFSANCVCVDVQGPDVPDLYFYDLPGTQERDRA